MQVDDVRKWHYLRKTGRTSIPRYVAFLAVRSEPVPVGDSTTKFIHVFRHAALIYGRYENGRLTRKRQVPCGSTEELWDAIQSMTSPDHKLWIFCHGLGQALTVAKFWQCLETGNFTIPTTVTKSPRPSLQGRYDVISHRGFAVLTDPPTIIKCECVGRAVEMVDVQNYHPVPLRQLADELDMTLQYELEPCERKQYYEMSSMLEAKVIERLMTNVISAWSVQNNGPFAATAAGLAFNAFRSRFMPNRSILVHGCRTALRLERHAYFGGQTIAPYVGDIGEPRLDRKTGKAWVRNNRPLAEGPIYVMDVNSLYPWIMLELPLPVKLFKIYHGGSLSEVMDKMGHLAVIANVKIDSPTDPYPVRLVSDKERIGCIQGSHIESVELPRAPRVVYARGCYWTCLCGPELSRAILDGYVKELGTWATYIRGYPFTEYIKHYMHMRQLAREIQDEPSERFAKLMLNSLWGKFGQRSNAWVSDSNIPAIKPWGSWVNYQAETCESVTYRSIAWHVQRQSERGETENSCPAIAAYITSYGRETMRSLRELVGYRHWFYQDTDSLHVDQDGFNTLVGAGQVHHSEPGKLKQEGVFYDGAYYGPKRYRTGPNWTVAGLKISSKFVEECHWTQDEYDRIQTVISGEPPSGNPSEVKHILLCQHSDESQPGVDGWCPPFTV